jgi:hypothetical protein
VRLIKLGRKHAAVTFTLALAGALTACGGDDNNGGGTGGTGGSGGTMVTDAAPDGSGGADSSQGGSGGTGGVDASVEAEAGPTGGGGNAPDAMDAPSPSDGSSAEAEASMTPDAPATSDVVDGGTSPEAEADGEVPDAPSTPDVVVDAGGPLIFSFTPPDPGVTFGWTANSGVITDIVDGSPASPGGAIEWTTDFGLEAGTLAPGSSVAALFSYSPENNRQGVTTYAGNTTLHMSLRLRTPPPPELLAITPFIIGGMRTDEVDNFSDYLEPLGQPLLWAGNNWIDTAINIGGNGDGGVVNVPILSDLWAFGVQLQLVDDAGTISSPVVIDIDNIYVTQ